MEREMDRGKVQVHILYFTRTGSALAAKLAQELAREANVTYASGKGCCKEWTAEHFRRGNVLVYIGACGIAVRAIAPHIGSKETDPAVIVIDEKGENVIPILAGHLGGANEWARKIAELTKGCGPFCKGKPASDRRPEESRALYGILTRRKRSECGNSAQICGCNPI